MTTTVRVWTAVLAAGGGSRWSQSERSNVPESSRSRPCIRDLNTDQQSVRAAQSQPEASQRVWGVISCFTWPARGERSVDTAPQRSWAHSRVHQSRKPFWSRWRLCPLRIKRPGRQEEEEEEEFSVSEDHKEKLQTHIFGTNILKTVTSWRHYSDWYEINRLQMILITGFFSIIEDFYLPSRNNSSNTLLRTFTQVLVQFLGTCKCVFPFWVT